jgi:3-hydroxyisobutyrate dehydrogenase
VTPKSKSPTTRPTVGFIGLGDQGEYIAHQIRDGGFPLHIWARRDTTLAPFVGTGTIIDSSAAAVGALCDVVELCVNFDDDVLQVVLGQDGVLEGMRPGGVIVVHSTVAPSTVIELAEAARPQGIDLLDAPVSGARKGAIEGTMSVIVGGETTVLERVRPVFETFAHTVTLVGDIGAGQVVKVLNNNVCFANLSLLLAARGIAEQLGLDVERTLDVIAASSGASFALGLARTPATMRLMAEPQNMRSNVEILAAVLAEHGIEGGELTALAAGAKARVVARVAELDAEKIP